MYLMHFFKTFYIDNAYICVIIKIGGDELKDRFKKLRKELGLSRDEFAKKLGLKSRGKIENIEFGRIEPDETFIKLVCKVYHVNYHWIIDGTGDMFKDDDSDAQSIVDSIMYGDNEFAKDILVRFARMDEKYWYLISDMIDSIERNEI